MTTIKFRRDTSANWTSVNPIPAQGEPCYETDTGKLKIGNGSDNYVTLPYVSDGGGSSGDLPIATATTLGGVKVGDNLSITEDGTLSASSEAKTVKTPNGRIKLDNGGLHNEDNSRSIINRNSDSLEVRVGNSYEPTIIDGNSIKLNSTNITDRNGNTFLSGDTINGVKLSTDGYGNKNIANSGYTNNRLELTANACNLYDSDNRQVFGSSYNSGIGKTDWKFASQSDTVRIAKTSAANAYGLMLQVPTDGTSPTIGYTYYGTDSSLYGKEQSFLRTEDVDNSTIKIVNGKLTASGGGSAPTNMVTTDTTQTISGDKTFTRGITTTDIYPSGEITFTRNSQYRYINYMDTISGGYHAQNGYITFNGDTTLVGDNKLVLNGRTGGLKLTAASSASITCENDLIAPNIRTTANGTIKLTHPMDTAEGLITFSNDYGQLSISSSGGSNNNLFGVVRGSAHALINGDNIETKDKDGNIHTYINTKNIDTTYMKWDDTSKKLKVDTAAVAHLAMPSNTKVNLTLGASYATYTAPADGWFTMAADGISRLVCAGNSSNTTSTFYGYSTDTNNPAQDNYLRSTIPVSKDQSIFIEYSGTPVNKALAFVYAEGTKPTNV